MDDRYRRAWRMGPDNFTPPTRTPWGGRFILDHLKAGLALSAERAAYAVVGEAWEISVEPSFPSRIVDLAGAPLLEELVAASPESALGPEAARRFGGCPLLVKLLDAALPLSVQVHPSDDQAGLLADESGKPESWVIVAAGPGAGLYLGFRDGVTRAAVAAALESEADLEPLLNFVPVSPGDCFCLDPGTVHAIGAGVTLVEPQAVVPGKRGVTYRFWDWNRRYDASGREAATGTARTLHRAESLAVTQFDGLRGEAQVASLRRHPRHVASVGAATHERYLDSSDFRVDRLRGTGRLALVVDRLLATVVLEGRVICRVGAHESRFVAGESFVVPYAASRAAFELEDALAIVSAPGA